MSSAKCKYRSRSFNGNNSDNERLCRLCLSSCSSLSSNPLISPCECRGTAAFIHVDCLEKWQDSVFPSTRGLRCTVCKSKIRHTNWKLTAKIYLGSKIVSFCTTIVTIGWALYTLVFMIPMRAFLQVSLLVLSNWLPKEGIEIDEKWQLKWVGPKSSRRLALLQKYKTKELIPDLEIVRPGCLLLSANQEQQSSSFHFSHKSVILITKHSADGTEGILINGRPSSSQNATERSSDTKKENYISVLFTVEDGGPVPSGFNILHNNSRVSGAVCLAEGLYMNKAEEVNGEQIKVGQEDVRRFKTLVDAIDAPSSTAVRRRKIFKNTCVWEPGQLEMEIKNGNMWYVINNLRENKINTSKYVLSFDKHLHDKLIGEIQFEGEDDDQFELVNPTSSVFVHRST